MTCSRPQVALDSGVPFVRFPCAGVTTHLRTSPGPEVARYVEGQGAIGDYLAETFYDYDPQQKPGWSKVIWDIVTIAYLVDATWTPSDIVHTPILTDQLTWSFDESRHLMRSVNYVKRNEIFGDLFLRLAEQLDSIGERPALEATDGSRAGGIAPTTDPPITIGLPAFDASRVGSQRMTRQSPRRPLTASFRLPVEMSTDHPRAGSGMAARRHAPPRAPEPSRYAACAAFTHPVRRYSPDRCCRTVVSPMPSSYAAAATEPARM